MVSLIASICAVAAVALDTTTDAADGNRRSTNLRAEDVVVAGLTEGMSASDVRRTLGRPQWISTDDDFRCPRLQACVVEI